MIADRGPFSRVRAADGRGQAEGFGVLHAPEVQPFGRGRHVAAGSVFRFKHFPRPLRLTLALADGDEQPRDVADHVVQEGVARHLDGDPVALPLDGELGQPAHRRLRLAFRRAKRAEVVMADQVGRRCAHALVIERAMNLRGVFLRMGRAHRAIEDQVAIGAGLRRVTRMEMHRHRRDPGDADIAGKIRVGAQRPATQRAHGVRYRSAPPADARARPHRCGRSRRATRARGRRSRTPFPRTPGCSATPFCWLCQPAYAEPSYSRPTARRGKARSPEN